MEKEALKRIFEFLEEKEGKTHKDKGSLKWKIIFNEPITKEDLNVKGGLNLSNKNITSLPEGLKVGGSLYIKNTKLTKYLDNELREMVKPGFIKGKIFRD